MTPNLLNRTQAFAAAYLDVLNAYKADEALNIKDVFPLCKAMLIAERDFISELLIEVSSTKQHFETRDLFMQTKSIINISDMFNIEWYNIAANSIQAEGENYASRLELLKHLRTGANWVCGNNELNFNRLICVLEDLKSSLSAEYSDHNTPAEDVPTEESNTDLNRAQRIALLYEVFRRLKVTTSKSSTSIAKLIEAVTGGNMKTIGKNTYAAKQLNAPLGEAAQRLVDDFFGVGVSET